MEENRSEEVKPEVRLSAFGDEISEDLSKQLSVLESHRIYHLELRSVAGQNVLEFDEPTAKEIARRIKESGFRLSAIASPLGKVPVEESFSPELERLKKAIDLAHIFETPNIRIFSFYIPENEKPEKFSSVVFRRLEKETSIAEEREVVLLHENEARIYGESPERCRQIFRQIPSTSLRGVFDPANFIVCGYESLPAWRLLKPYIVHFHIKDAQAATKKVVPAGKGDGHIEEVLRGASEEGFRGFLTLEPHLIQAGESVGFTGPERFAEAAEALKEILERVGARYG